MSEQFYLNDRLMRGPLSSNSGPEIDHGILKGLLLCLFSGLYLYPFMRALWPLTDEGIFLYGAQSVAEGALPYRDFFEVVGPGSLYCLALFFKVFGISWLVARGFWWITAIITIILVYWITRRLYRGPFDYIPALFYLLISFPIMPVISQHWDSNLFGLLAVASFFLWNHTRHKRYLVTTGFIAGLTSCFMPQKGLLLFFALITVVIIDGNLGFGEKREVLTGITVMTVAFAIVGIFVLSLFYFAGGLDELIYANLIFPLKQYKQINVTPFGGGILRVLLPPIEQLFEFFGLPPPLSHGFGIITLIPFFIILALPLLLIIVIPKIYLNPKERPQIFRFPVITCFITGIAFWISETHRMDLMHLIYGSPVLVILLFSLLIIRFDRKKTISRLALIIVMIPLFFVTAFYLGTALAAKHELLTRRGAIYTFQKDTALEFLHESVPAGSMVFIYPYRATYYFLANIRNPTRYSHLLYHYNTEAQFNEAITDLEAKKVKYVLLDALSDEKYLRRFFPNYVHPPEEKLVVEKYLQKHYKEMEVRYGFRILERIEGLRENPHNLF